MPGNIINLTPAEIATWPAPNYKNPQTRDWMPVYASVFYGTMTVMVVTRIAVRLRKYSGGFGLDDILLICSWFCMTAFTVLAILGAKVYYTNRHLWDIPFTGFVGMAKVTWLAELFFLLTGCCVKVSVLLFYRRLVENTCSRYWTWAVVCAISVTVAYTLAFILALVFNCSPTEAYWKAFNLTYAATVTYHCADTTAINLLAGILAIVSDLYAVVLPCVMLRHLELPRRQKVALNIVFSLGLLVVGASGVRTYWLWKCGHTPDVSTAIFNVFAWSVVELNLGIMCAAAPALRVVFRDYLSEPLSRLKHSVKSVTSNTRSGRRSEHFSEGNRGTAHSVESQEHLRSHESDTKFDREGAGRSDTVFSGPTIVISEASKSPTSTYFEVNDSAQSPTQHETHNLQDLEKYRRASSLQSRYQPEYRRPSNMPARYVPQRGYLSEDLEMHAF